MATQNINNYYFNRFDANLDDSAYTDFFLVADEKEYDQEVVFSTQLIAYNDGQRLPISIELANTGSSQNFSYLYGDYISGNTLVSLNNYNNNPLNDTCYSAFTGICDVGLTAIDNGLVTGMTGNTLYFSMGIRDDYKFDPLHYDRRFKTRPITGYTQSPNERFSGITAQTLYNIVTKTADTIGQYYELYGGYLQGFYKLYGWDYETMPERPNKGWTVEMLLKPRLVEEFLPQDGQTYLNDIYPENAGTFFFMGARAENKFYHYAAGSASTDSGYTRVTSGLTGCIGTCACSDSAVTTSNCYTIYPLSAITIQKNCSTTEVVIQEDKDPELDVYSNAMSIRFSGDPSNPRLCVKYILWTGDCITTGSCETTGLTFQTGYTISEVCSTEGIYNICDSGQTGIERWVMVDVVFERNITWLDCDLPNMGGLNDLRKLEYTASTVGNSVSLIQPPSTRTGNTYPQQVEVIDMKAKWLLEKSYRMGKLKFYVNGKHFMTVDNFEEIIPRELNDVKERQIGVPFNISWGGGTFGLRESLTFSGCSGATGPYIQDPEVMCDETLSGTSLSGLTTPILLEPTFGGTFMGGISEFRMYIEPLKSPQIQHNYRILKDKFNLINLDCADTSCIVDEGDFTVTLVPAPTPTVTPTPSVTPTMTITPTPSPILNYYQLETCCDGQYFIFNNYPNTLSIGSVYNYLWDGTNDVCATVVPYSGLGSTYSYVGPGNPVLQPSCASCTSEIPCVSTTPTPTPTLTPSPTPVN